eukprot:Amastigsp_a177061_10.p3 type:complete len:132 gc:universal Amastigsp_a177061_10:659-1054(+)
MAHTNGCCLELMTRSPASPVVSARENTTTSLPLATEPRTARTSCCASTVGAPWAPSGLVRSETTYPPAAEAQAMYESPGPMSPASDGNAIPTQPAAPGLESSNTMLDVAETTFQRRAKSPSVNSKAPASNT